MKKKQSEDREKDSFSLPKAQPYIGLRSNKFERYLPTKSATKISKPAGYMREAGWGESPVGLAGAEDTGHNSSGPDVGKKEKLAQESCGPNLSHRGGSFLE
ncbi:hypothetical protein TIFTF001_038548 [Ficus carica]|uniref:Uncharacterized protein n=1 Tax=Ficus carica TaxID=3494 RepID=A0AA88JA12_FICCA|nr:hypothetical protein TIFTF001_038548 [Ficus carica]